MKIVTVIGARPQFIKAAAVSRIIASRPEIKEVIVHTGQHFDGNMSDIFFEEMQIPHPDYHLEINSVGHGAMTGRMLEKIEEVLLKEKPDYVLVYGDTNSTLAGALAAKKLHIRVVHVEAGLRSFNMRMPEEINRILTDRISDILCCPTVNAIENLATEGFGHFPCTVANTGDVMQDTALFYSGFSVDKSTVMKTLELEGRDFALCTIHRAENTDDADRLASIFAALKEICRDTTVVLPLHPRTQKIASGMGLIPETAGEQSGAGAHRLAIIAPVGYFDMIELLKHSKAVLTDSGGLQKEAFFFKKPCITLRDETEWVELVGIGANLLVGADHVRIIKGYREMLAKSVDFPDDLYGGGRAAASIIALLLSFHPETLTF